VVCNVTVPRGIDDPGGQDRLAAGFRLRDYADHCVTLEQRRHEGPVQHRVDARLGHQRVRDDFEAFRVDLVRE
jgi:hypothetical protein